VSELEYYTFIETAVFTKHIDSKASLDEPYAIQSDLIVDPKRGDIVQGTTAFAKRVSPTCRAAEATAAAIATCTPSIVVSFTCCTPTGRMSRAIYLLARRRQRLGWRGLADEHLFHYLLFFLGAGLRFRSPVFWVMSFI